MILAAFAGDVTWAVTLFGGLSLHRCKSCLNLAPGDAQDPGFSTFFVAHPITRSLELKVFAKENKLIKSTSGRIPEKCYGYGSFSLNTKAAPDGTAYN